MEILVKECKLTPRQLGFDFQHFPNKQYLLDILYFLKPECSIFKPGALDNDLVKRFIP